MIEILYTYFLFFEKVYIFKPKTSNSIGGEFYIICKRFKGIDEYKMNYYFEKYKKIDVNINDNVPKKFKNLICFIFFKILKYKIKNVVCQNLLIQNNVKYEKIIKKNYNNIY